MKHLKLLSTIGFVLLTVLTATAQTDPEQEIYSCLTKELVIGEEKGLALSKKRVNEIPKDDTVMIRKAKLVLDLKNRDTAFIVLVNKTVPYPYKIKEEELKKELPSCDSDMYSDFIKRNEKPCIIKPIIKLGNKLVYFTEDDYNMIFKHWDKDWTYFHEIYGLQPIIRYSRPGFNAKGDRALLYCETLEGMLHSRGQFLIFKKIKGVWINADEIADVWIS